MLQDGQIQPLPGRVRLRVAPDEPHGHGGLRQVPRQLRHRAPPRERISTPPSASTYDHRPTDDELSPQADIRRPSLAGGVPEGADDTNAKSRTRATQRSPRRAIPPFFFFSVRRHERGELDEGYATVASPCHLTILFLFRSPRLSGFQTLAKRVSFGRGSLSVVLGKI